MLEELSTFSFHSSSGQRNTILDDLASSYIYQVGVSFSSSNLNTTPSKLLISHHSWTVWMHFIVPQHRRGSEVSNWANWIGRWLGGWVGDGRTHARTNRAKTVCLWPHYVVRTHKKHYDEKRQKKYKGSPILNKVYIYVHYVFGYKQSVIYKLAVTGVKQQARFLHHWDPQRTLAARAATSG